MDQDIKKGILNIMHDISNQLLFINFQSISKDNKVTISMIFFKESIDFPWEAIFCFVINYNLPSCS